MYENFIQEFKEFQADAYQINEAHGFNETDHQIEQALTKLGELYPAFKYARQGLKIALIMSELGEMIDGIRKGNAPDTHIPQFSCLEAEGADAIIRIMNLCFPEKARLAEALVAKNEYNRMRPYRHGGKKF